MAQAGEVRDLHLSLLLHAALALDLRPGTSALGGSIAWITADALLIEMVLIAYAAALGTTGHFNVSTPVSAAVWTTMGLSVMLVWAANLLTIVLLLIQRLPYPAFAWSLRLGLIVSFVGWVWLFL